MPINRADINPLVGRRFVSASGNTCRVERIGEGAMRLVWSRKRAETTEQDLAEAHAWVRSVLGSVDLTVSRGRENEAESYQKWRQK